MANETEKDGEVLSLRPKEGQMAGQSRKYPRLRVSTPFPCLFAQVKVDNRFVVERGDLGVVYDVSAKGARVMTEAVIAPGDQIAISLRLPKQSSSMFVELATVRWRNEQTYGVEFEGLSFLADLRLKKYIARQSKTSLPLAG
jgi:PilZ domain